MQIYNFFYNYNAEIKKKKMAIFADSHLFNLKYMFLTNKLTTLGENYAEKRFAYIFITINYSIALAFASVGQPGF